MDGTARVGEAIGALWPQAIANNNRMVKATRPDRRGIAKINFNCAYPFRRREIYPGEDIGRHWTVRCLTGEIRSMNG